MVNTKWLVLSLIVGIVLIVGAGGFYVWAHPGETPINWDLTLIGKNDEQRIGAVIILVYHPMIAPVLVYERFEAFGLDYARSPTVTSRVSVTPRYARKTS
jgi:hypothetical protein